MDTPTHKKKWPPGRCSLSAGGLPWPYGSNRRSYKGDGMSTALFVLTSLSVLVGMAALVFAVRILQSALESEQMGRERLEILREQQERWEFLREERRLLLEELREERDRHAEVERAWQESLVVQDNGRALPAVRGAPEEAPRRRWRWIRIFDG
jgi:hypothetical protein